LEDSYICSRQTQQWKAGSEVSPSRRLMHLMLRRQF
jgi:hypothetical protein